MKDLSLYRKYLNTKTSDDKTEIFDPVRRRWLIISPEEMIRQCVVAYLHHELSISYKRMNAEKGIRLHHTSKRYDILVYDRELIPSLLVECKAPTESLTNEVIDQILRYNIQLRAPYLWITNGIQHLVFCLDNTNKAFKKIDGLPDRLW